MIKFKDILREIKLYSPDKWKYKVGDKFLDKNTGVKFTIVKQAEGKSDPELSDVVEIGYYFNDDTSFVSERGLEYAISHGDVIKIE